MPPTGDLAKIFVNLNEKKKSEPSTARSCWSGFRSISRAVSDAAFHGQTSSRCVSFIRHFTVQQICQTLSDKLLLAGKIQTASGKSPAQRREKSRTVSDRLSLDDLVACFPLPWSAYVRLLSVKNEQARKFYEAEALRGGWSVRQLDWQINSLFYERTALSRNKAKMLSKGALAKREDAISPEEE